MYRHQARRTFVGRSLDHHFHLCHTFELFEAGAVPRFDYHLELLSLFDVVLQRVCHLIEMRIRAIVPLQFDGPRFEDNRVATMKVHLNAHTGIAYGSKTSSKVLWMLRSVLTVSYTGCAITLVVVAAQTCVQV